MALVQFNAKVYPETFELFNRLMEESDSQTKGKFLDLLLENYLNPRTITETSEDDKKLIIEQNQKLEFFSDRFLELEEEKIKFEASCIDLTEKLNRAQVIHNDLLTQIETGKLSDYQVLITFEPHVMFFVHSLLQEYEKRKMNTTAGEMLKNLFWNYISKGAGDYLPVIYSNGYVRSVLESYKTGEKPKQETNGA